jgi:Flp pilus assembly protein TadG
VGRTRRTDRQTSARPRECGFVAIWMAMVLIVLLGVAAFAVDLMHAYVVAQEAQNAADAAALGGVIEVPKSAASADSRARSLAQANGFNSAEVTPHASGTNQLTVDVTRHMLPRRR